MNDTRPEISKKIRHLMKQKSGEERMLMGFSMFQAAKEMVLASLHANKTILTPNALKKELFLRFYGNDFDAETKTKILSKLSSNLFLEIKNRPA
ncbi:MAG: hypothetical protein A3B70_00855 [Deltaproteobacteria bacterium RIFCSPHIGHO2_02_FULL_40_11]|nr:MAG: hypothetical protein A3B70_00855 [Deltaproteobacteria bacterium RIFCSPHIGHO2_02_FULL_40_11]